ncbi:MAG: hypothetical protein V4538_02465 [Bacteroidota bacterium]
MTEMTARKARKPTPTSITATKPYDYELILNVNRNAEEKEMDRYCIKLWWLNSTNGKPTYVLKGMQLFETLLRAGKKPPTVLAAIVTKFNENVATTLKMEVYDNTVYGQVTKVLVFNGIETTIHKDYNNVLFKAVNNINVGFRPNTPHHQ